jgi:hypothetical protein
LRQASDVAQVRLDVVDVCEIRCSLSVGCKPVDNIKNLGANEEGDGEVDCNGMQGLLVAGGGSLLVFWWILLRFLDAYPGAILTEFQMNFWFNWMGF